MDYVDLSCSVCHKIFTRKKYEYIRQLKRNPKTKFCCSRGCQLIYRASAGGQALRKPLDEFKTKLFNKINKVLDKDSCWNWLGYINPFTGYGQIGYTKRTLKSHRETFKLVFNCDLTEDQQVCHTCDNRVCCRPQHMFIGTIQDNQADKICKNRQVKGEDVHCSKLTEDQVKLARNLYKNNKTASYLAKKFKIDVSTMWRVVNRRYWKHVI